MTLAIHSEVKDVTGGQCVVHVQSKEPGGEPSATAPHGELGIRQPVNHARSGTETGGDVCVRDIRLGGLGRAPPATAVLALSHVLTDTGVAFQKVGFGTEGGERSGPVWPRWLPGYPRETHLSASGAFKINT